MVLPESNSLRQTPTVLQAKYDGPCALAKVLWCDMVKPNGFKIELKINSKYCINSPNWFDCQDLFIIDLLIHYTLINTAHFRTTTKNILFEYNMNFLFFALEVYHC